MKKGDLALYISLAVIIFIFFGIFFLPMFIVYGGFGLLDPFAVKERYTSDCYISLLSEEPFENVTVIIPTAKLGSVELSPKNFETIQINNRTYIKLTGDKPLSEKLWPERKNETLHRMEFRVEFPKMSIENLSEYKIDDESVRVLLNYTNASYVRLYISLYYLEFDYVDILGKRFYTNFGHYDSLRCWSVVNVTEVERNKWILAPVSCES